jgi:Holliday junction resolvasome RuvABC endonuclease subunit
MKMVKSDPWGQTMKVLGIKCSKQEVGWILLEGNTRADATVVAHDQAKAPPTDRAEQLAWGRKELLEVVEKHSPDVAALRVTEGQNGSFGRAEMDGVVQAALYESKIPVHRLVAASIRSKFMVRKKEQVDAAVAALPASAPKTPAARKELLTVAAAIFPN